MENSLGDKKNILLALFIILALLAGGGIGYSWGRAAGESDPEQDPFYLSDTTTIVQRTIVAKGEISTIADQTIVITPLAQTAEADDKLSITIDDETAIYLQLQSEADSQDSPQKVTLDELQKGDAVDVIMSLDADRNVTANTVSARRSP